MAASARRSSPPLALHTYDPFGPSSSSFLPPIGLFSPVAAPSRPTPNFCATIFEEEDTEESAAEDMRSSASSSTTITPSTPDSQRRQSASSSFAIHPRILRSDSCSDDDSDIPPVLRFPVPPSTIPTTRSPPKRVPALKPVSIPPPPSQLKSCFEDDDDDDEQVVVAPSPVSSRRSSPTVPTTLMASRPAPPPPGRPFALLKKATSALKSSSPPRPASKLATGEKPLPKAPHSQRPRITPAPYDEQQPISVSPTPSLSSSSSSSDCSSATLPYIPVGSIIPAPAIVQDLDDYLETLEMYFPSELWEDHPHELRRKPNSAATKSRSSSSSSSSSSSAAGAGAHRKRPSNSSSSSSCSRSSSDENLQHRRKSSFDDPVVDVQRLLKNSASSGNMKLASYTSTSSTTVRISSPLSPPAEIRSHSRSGSDSPTSTAYSSSASSSSSSPSNSSTITPGSRTPSPTFPKHTTPLSPPKSILKPSKSSPLLRDRSASVSSTISVVSPPPVPRSSSRSSAYNNVPMSPTRGRAPVPMHQLLSR